MLQNRSIWLLAFVFFVVGALFCMNDVIFPYAKEYFKLSYFQATLIQWTFYLVYLPFPFIVSNLVDRFGYKLAVIAATLITILGSLVFYLSYHFSSFGILLGSIFIISMGIMILNVAANPFATLLGSPEQSQLRINFVQVFSRIGYAVTPVLGNFLVQPKDGGIPTIYLPYLLLAFLFTLILIAIPLVKMPDLKPEQQAKMELGLIIKKALRIRHLYLGAIAMFFYVGAEACAASFFINYCLENSLNSTVGQVSVYLAWYYILAGIGGFAGIYILKYFPAGKVVGVFSLILILLFIGTALHPQLFNPYGIVSIGFFISLMFPTVFGLSIEKLGEFTNSGAALVSFAIFGGAVFPPIQGLLADNFNVSVSYLIPAFCFIFIAFYGFLFSKPETNIENKI